MARPSERQLEWADMEVGVIIHHLMDIYNPEYKGYKTAGVREHMPPRIFAPMQLDTDQWIAAAKAAGAKYGGVGLTYAPDFPEQQEPNIFREPFERRGIRVDIL